MPKYIINAAQNGVEIYFDNKPDIDILEALKDEGWRWHRTKQCWYNRKNDETIAFARMMCGNSIDESRGNYPTAIQKRTVQLNQSIGNQVVSKLTITEDGGVYQTVSSNNMIICSDCKRFVSIHATACPFCGCPLSHIVEYYFKQFISVGNQQNQQRQATITKLKELQEETRRRELAEEAQRQKVLAKVKSEISPLDWKKEFEDYSIEKLNGLKEQVDSDKKYAAYLLIPKEFLEHHSDYWSFSSFKRMTWRQIEGFQIEVEMYKEARTSILQTIKSRAKERFERDCEELEAARVTKLSQRNGISERRASWKNCRKCGTIFVGESQYCTACNPYKGLDTELQKLGINSGAFNKQASILAPYMRPVGVTNEDHRRFVDKMERDESFIPNTDNYEDPPRDIQTKEDKLKQSIRLQVRDRYRKKVSKLMLSYPKDDIGKHKDAFYEIATALQICEDNERLTRYLDAYAVENYRNDNM